LRGVLAKQLGMVHVRLNTRDTISVVKMDAPNELGREEFALFTVLHGRRGPVAMKDV